MNKKQWFLNIEGNKNWYYIPIEINEKYLSDYTSDNLKIHYQYIPIKFSLSKKYVYDIDVRGKYKRWGLPVEATPKEVEAWREDGIEISRIMNSIPTWWVDMGFSVRFWCFWQDVFNFNNPFAK